MKQENILDQLEAIIVNAIIPSVRVIKQEIPNIDGTDEDLNILTKFITNSGQEVKSNNTK
mgnify:CR=1 FL=1